ncbi:MAG: hypothetical protein BroJett018_26280 [Chloroflexota bacterium]|nr:MAG: hypothetical protein BroJett018_26280 [Chloroflexota bacterium]
MTLTPHIRNFLNRDLPTENLRQGDVAWLLDTVSGKSGGEDGCVLEIFNMLGESIHVAIVPASAIEPLRADLVPSVREIESQA